MKLTTKGEIVVALSYLALVFGALGIAGWIEGG